MFEIKINLGVTPELANLATTLIKTISKSSSFGMAPATGTVESKSALQPNKLPPDSAAPTPNPTPAPRKRAKSKPVTDPESDTTAPATSPETNTTAAPVTSDDKLTEEDVRAAMHKTRIRIEGADYKTNQDGDGYTKFHRALTCEFKKLAAALGAAKPSALPPEKRYMFISQCDELDVDANGKIAINPPF